MLETPVQQRLMEEIARKGGLPQRNNVGGCIDSTGRAVRYGLLNSSKKQNDKIKSSDLICCVPVFITQQMIGQFFGMYVAIEAKHSEWNHGKKLDAHEEAQAEYHRVIRAHGGRAGFATGIDDVRRILAGEIL